MTVCGKHIKNPAHIYGQCIGCELENLQSTIQELRKELILEVEGHTYTAQLFVQQRQENERLKLTIKKDLKKQIVITNDGGETFKVGGNEIFGIKPNSFIKGGN